MNLNADLQAYLPQFRAEAESRMTSRATVRRRTGNTTQDETTGRVVPVWATPHARVPFRLRVGRNREVTVGGVQLEEATAEGHLPASVKDLRDGDHIDILTGEWAGTAWRIVEAAKGDQMTARRVPVVQVDRPGEW